MIQTKRIGGLEGSTLSYFISRHYDRALLVYPLSANLEEESRSLEFFSRQKNLGACARFPAFENAYDAAREDPRTVYQRLQTQLHLSSSGSQRPAFVLTNLVALSQKTISSQLLHSACISFEKGAFFDRDDLILRLQAAGYIRDELAQDHGTFSVRGLLIDVFPPFDEQPLRLEFFGDEIISIRRFDPESQRSLIELNSYTLPPCRELILSADRISSFRKNLKDFGDSKNIAREDREAVLLQLENHRELVESRTLLPALGERLVDLWDYLPKDWPIVWINRKQADEEASRFWLREDSQFAQLQHLAYGPESLRSDHAPTNRVESELSTLIDASAEINYQSEALSTLRSRILGSKSLQPLIDTIHSNIEKQFEVHLVLNNMKRRESLLESLSLSSDSSLIQWHQGPLFSGFSSGTLRSCYITERDIFGARSSPKTVGKRVEAKDYLREFSDLVDGDYVVHEEHGLGRFKGLITLELHSVTSEFALIEYADADKLYLPIYRLDQISRYVPGDGYATPRLDKLGSQVFAKKKQRAREDILKLAHELLDVAAKRKLLKIERAKLDLQKYHSFCNDFPFELTPDQESTMADVESDLKKEVPMDRLVCGDVGFGKTEIALRAAMYRALQGTQIIVLAPTTLLVEQHFKGFQKRFAPYGIRVERLSRFLSAKEQRQVLDRVESGATQIIVGTHRLLQSDVRFNHAGLLIVDEEQRFGVKHKERMKKLRSEMDILTLSATPIPRTLQMAIVGLRELSLITTPPETREAVNTFVGRFDSKLIRDASLRELQRDGQILFIHNRVQSIYRLEQELKKLLPEFRILVGHGQMPEADLEKVMADFLDHRADILLATSIIENGLDIANANTIFVDHAEHFGLSDLYQIRGRVGRSHRRAYAYFLIHEESSLTPEASKRLQVIQSCTELGSGFKVASHDLEIRGSGNLLGDAQSGVIAEVGLELYNEMLHECLTEIRNEVRAEPLPDLQSGYSAYIPADYISDAGVRISTYRRFNQIRSDQELLDFESELLDRFGLYPEEVDLLCQIASLRSRAAKLRAKAVEIRPGRMLLEFKPNTPLDPQRVLKDYSPQVSLDPKGRLNFNFKSAMLDAQILSTSSFRSPALHDLFECRQFLKKLTEDVSS
jgi:transcription-repair coupling factor (superfamily II helicase)